METIGQFKLGPSFEIDPDGHGLGCIRRRLIYKDKRPVGHYSDGCYIEGGYLWLQTYVGYQKANQFTHFQTLEAAMAACEYLYSPNGSFLYME
jgi:hypothetical protein